MLETLANIGPTQAHQIAWHGTWGVMHKRTCSSPNQSIGTLDPCLQLHGWARQCAGVLGWARLGCSGLGSSTDGIEGFRPIPLEPFCCNSLCPVCRHAVHQ